MKAALYIGLVLVAFQSNAQLSDFDTIDFQKADHIALECNYEGLQNLPKLSHQLTSKLTTDVEKFRAIFTWVCTNVANDYRRYEQNMRKRRRFKNDSLKLSDWNTDFRKLSFQKLLEDQKTICTGYAYLVNELSRLANINCKIIHGFAKTSTIDINELDVPNHSWNAVELNGKWYLCDPTWASGTPNSSTNQFEFNYNDGFFLSNPRLFAINHYPVEKKWLLLNDQDSSFEAFIDAPVLYGKAYLNIDVYSEPKKMHNTVLKNEPVVFKLQLTKPTNIEDISLLVDNGSTSIMIHPESTSIKDQTLTVEYKFERSGLYDVHLLIRSDMVSTHTFKVKS